MRYLRLALVTSLCLTACDTTSPSGSPGGATGSNGQPADGKDASADGRADSATPGGAVDGAADDAAGGGQNGASNSPSNQPDSDAAMCATEIVVCSDFVDDDCDGKDEPCPTTQSAVKIPDWDCVGKPPTGVVAVASFGAKDCVVFFESSAGAIYVAPLRSEPAGGTSCPSFDERRYAFTLAGETADCAAIDIEADFSENPELAVQPVSNECRKFVHPMSQPLSYVASNRSKLKSRVEAFETLEIACVGYRDWPYKWQSLLRAKIELL